MRRAPLYHGGSAGTLQTRKIVEKRQLPGCPRRVFGWRDVARAPWRARETSLASEKHRALHVTTPFLLSLRTRGFCRLRCGRLRTSLELLSKFSALALQLQRGGAAVVVPPGVAVRCVALGPAPVYRGSWPSSPPSCVRIYINNRDVVPRLRWSILLNTLFFGQPFQFHHVYHV